MTKPRRRRIKHKQAIRRRLTRLINAVERIAEAVERIATAPTADDMPHQRHARADWIAPTADDLARLEGVPQPDPLNPPYEPETEG